MNFFKGAKAALDTAANAVAGAAKVVINEGKSSEVTSKIFAAFEKVQSTTQWKDESKEQSTSPTVSKSLVQTKEVEEP